MPENSQNKSSQKLENLRAEMKTAKVDAFLIPREDEWQGEYVPERAQRLSWLTGFTGSAGLALVTKDKAAVFSDSRYTLQLKQQLNGSSYEGITHDHAKNQTPKDWLVTALKKGNVVGYDPKLHTSAQISELEEVLNEHGIRLEPVADNLVDNVWDNQPDHPDAGVTIFPDTLSGETVEDKVKRVLNVLEQQESDAAFITAPDSIAWLLNIRGNDVPHVPVVLSYLLVHSDGTLDWFVPENKISDDLQKHLGDNAFIYPLEDIQDVLDARVAETDEFKTILIDSSNAAIQFQFIAEDLGLDIVDSKDPCAALKAQKNSTEIDGLKQAHIVDGVAVSRLLKWVEDNAGSGQVSEQDVENQLLEFRKKSDSFTDTSFDTISGWAGNGAIVHYRVTDDTNKTIQGSGLLLVDSGGQYLSDTFAGTTDITRTVAVGTPTQEMQENFTRVLKGHIGIAMARFPQGTSGAEIDVLARQALWQNDLDFGHGTGHGVGHYLSVHETGTGLSSRATTAFKPGMFLSNEPGYYKEGEYGIRIENLILVEADGQNASTDKVMLKFNTVSFAPIDRKLIVADMLTEAELDWLNDYHQQVYDALSPHMDQDEVKWLQTATAPLAKSTLSGPSPA